MPTITIRLDAQTRTELDTTAASSGLGVSELVRRLIDQALGRAAHWREGDAPTSLSPTDRLLLSQNALLLAVTATDPDVIEMYQRNADILQNGWTAEYPTVFGDLRDEMDVSQNRLVWDILDMFRVLKVSCNELDEDDIDRLEAFIDRTRFSGFDLADPIEGPMLGYLEFLIRTERWTDVAERIQEIGDRGNSHSRQLPRYTTMLDVFRPIYQAALRAGRSKGLLTLDEIRRIATA
ncbi:YfbU family protein [Rhodococcus sp. BP-149]|nr:MULTISPECIES: YfbU family protein [unclassified Rhodococcus (in: high G+C Gram-positive bacteria)]MBY6695684.1 YfbU family protein [Rhodococcus sp. BP-188]MBY6700518.1 YfbU family protein [Rhodococcus sp. BP-285]MBY6704459.1 YfbU family protein [Rhodococcus sp. BP-283]MBY6713643.1 YfbU family protein [Rhodococcus sp. BP-160]MBY6721905.1 YfbU family protein [Rhodococcus sp. BP-142]